MGAMKKTLFGGVDWARRYNDACIVSADGIVVDERRFDNTGEGIQAMVAWLAKHAGGRLGRIAVGIETPHGPIVEALLERKASVFSINPKQLDKFRSRFSASIMKDDKLDARVLADSVRTDRRAFRAVKARSATQVELTEWTRLLRDLTQERVGLTNRFSAQLQRYFPQFLLLNKVLHRPWVLALWKLIPTPEVAHRSKLDDVAETLRAHRGRRLSAAQVLEVLTTTPVSVAAGTLTAVTSHIEFLVESIELLNQQCLRAQANIDRCLELLEKEQRDVEILHSLPGVGRVVLATLLTEAYEPLASRDYHALRALAGTAPVTRKSGRVRTVTMRRACPPRLRDAVFPWARIAAIREPRCKARYAALRARGKTHGRALRTIADRLLSVACKMLETQTEFDPKRYALQKAA